LTKGFAQIKSFLAVENLRISALLLSSEHAHLPEVSSAARSQRALNFEFFKSLEIVGFFNNLKGFAQSKSFRLF